MSAPHPKYRRREIENGWLWEPDPWEADTRDRVILRRYLVSFACLAFVSAVWWLVHQF